MRTSPSADRQSSPASQGAARARCTRVRRRLFGLVLLGAGSGFGVLVHHTMMERRHQDREIEAELLRSARLGASMHRAALETARGLVEGLALHPSVLARDAEGCTALVRRLVRTGPYANAGALTPDGTAFCSANGAAARVDASDRMFFTEPLETGDFAVGTFTMERLSGKRILPVVAPATDRSGQLQAIAFVSIDVARFYDLLASVPHPPGTVATLVDREGVVVARHPDHERWTGTRLPDVIREELSRAREGVREVAGFDGVRRVWGFAPVSARGGRPDLLFVVGVPREVAAAPLDARLNRSFVAYATVILATLVAASLLGDVLIARRLERVAVTARRMADGDLSARSGFEAEDEIGLLGRTLDDMAIALDRSIRRNRLVLDSAGVGICGVDAAGVVEFANPTACEILREPRLVGETLERFAGERVAGAEAGASDARESARGVRAHWRRTDGSEVPVEWPGTPLRDGHTPGAVVIFQDVSDRVRLEARLLQAERLEAVGRLAGGVAHDFNNLLTAILSLGRFVRDELGPDHAVSPDLEEILSVAQRATSLTRQLLAFGRRQPTQAARLDVNEVVGTMQRMLERLIGDDVEIRWTLDASVPFVTADRGHIEQIVLNLALNARDAMPRGGTLVIGTSDADLGSSNGTVLGAPAGRYVMLGVSDTGVGMDERTAARIFEPFFTTKVGRGTGLGLSTVHGLVKQSGGDMHVSSAQGRGTTFRVYLPVAVAASAERAVTAAAPVRSIGNETILLVEDHDHVRSVAARALRAGGYRVLEARTGRDALELAASLPAPIELLLTDVVMPGMSGPELATQLGRRARIRTVFMSGYTGSAVLDSHVLEPGFSYLQKPFTPESLLDAVRSTLDRATGDALASGSQPDEAGRSAAAVAS